MHQMCNRGGDFGPPLDGRFDRRHSRLIAGLVAQDSKIEYWQSVRDGFAKDDVVERCQRGPLQGQGRAH